LFVEKKKLSELVFAPKSCLEPPAETAGAREMIFDERDKIIFQLNLSDPEWTLNP